MTIICTSFNNTLIYHTKANNLIVQNLICSKIRMSYLKGMKLIQFSYADITLKLPEL